MERNLLRTLIDAVPDLIYAKGLDGKYVLSNVAHSRFVGQPVPDNVIGHCAADFFPTNVAAKLDLDDQKIFRLGVLMLNGEDPIADSDGHTMWMARTKVPLRDPAGKIVGLVGISRNITLRKEAEARLNALNETLEERVAERSAAAEQRAGLLSRSEDALRTQTRILRLVLTSMGDGVVVAEKGGRVILNNPAAAQWFGPVLAETRADEQLLGLYLPDGQTPYPAGDRPLARACAAKRSTKPSRSSVARPRLKGSGSAPRPVRCATTMGPCRARWSSTGISLGENVMKQTWPSQRSDSVSWPSASMKCSGCTIRSPGA